MKKGAPPKIAGLVFVQPLGSGGYADVFLYEQQSPRMPVAVKVLKSEGLTDALRQQFVEEADTMAALAAANEGHQVSYGEDDYTARLQ